MTRSRYYWRDLGPAPAPQPNRSRPAATKRACASPRCLEPRRADSRFCAEHAAQLARVRAALNAEADFRRSGKPTGKRKTPICCAPHCFEPRIAPAAFCVECQHAGWVEETA